MKECWINVYENGFGRGRHACLADALLAANEVKLFNGHKILYRIHVRMK